MPPAPNPYPILHFLPWCPIGRRYRVGDAEIIPFHRGKPIDHTSVAEQQQINGVLSSYRTLDGNPVTRAALVRKSGAGTIARLEAQEWATLREDVDLACFASIASRDLFRVFGNYSNATLFTLIGQTLGGGSSSWTALRIRHRDGNTLDGRNVQDIQVSMPVAALRIENVVIDEPLANALVAFRAAATDREWSRWQHAISCYNQGNTDDETIQYQVEWGLLASAFERILDADSKAVDVANKFGAAFAVDRTLPVSTAERKKDSWRDPTSPLRVAWMREFYEIRGDFAHGKLATNRTMAWIPEEHLLIASVAFQLLVRQTLAARGFYTLTRDETVMIGAFEHLADCRMFEEPPDCDGSGDMWWPRIISDAKFREIAERTVNDAIARVRREEDGR